MIDLRHYGLKIKIPPQQEVISLTSAKNFLSVNSTADDDLITGLCSAAREVCEAFTRRAFINTVFEQRFETFPLQFPYIRNVPMPVYDGNYWNDRTILHGNIMELARPAQATSITIAYLDQTGATQSFTQFDADDHSEPTRLMPKVGQSWPTTDFSIAPVTVTFTSGYGVDPEQVPVAIRLAIKQLVALWYRDREADVSDMPESVKRVLWLYRVDA